MARSTITKSAVTQLLGSAAAPVYVLDEKRRIIYCNPACAEWLELDAQSLIGLRCDYQSGEASKGATSVSNDLCPPPEVLAGQRVTTQLNCASAAGEVKRRSVDFIPLGTDAMECRGVIAVLATQDGDAEGGEAEPFDLHGRVRDFRRKECRRFRLERLVGESPAMRRIRGQVRLAIAGRPQVTISGPPGSGREHLARTIHFHEFDDAAPPLVPLSCAVLDAELLQSTIEAFVRSCAELETARPAALLLLDVDQLPQDAQAALLGFLNIAEFDLHVIATTRQSLLSLVEQEGFRPDLAYALSTLVIDLPPLSQRREDIPWLAQLLLEEINATGKRQVSGFSPEALDELLAYPWPENLDELSATVRQAHRQAEGPRIEPDDLPDQLRLAADAVTYAPRQEESIVLDDLLAEVESEVIAGALRRAKGNKTKAARLLGIHRARLLRRMAQLKLT